MISDAHARTVALSPDRSFIVQAPAGSGKTGLLVYRLLSLLATVDQPQQVLAITFTRKATSEMRERLLELLNAAEQGISSDDGFEQQGIDLAHKVLHRDREKKWNLLNTPHQLQLLTIDAFCAKLTASMPWLSRLGDRPNTTNQADAHYDAAVESLLNELLNKDSAISAPLQTVMLELDFNYNKARQLFRSMLAKRDQWLRHLLGNNVSSLREVLEAAWQEVIDQQLQQAQTQLPDATVAQLVALAITAAGNIKVEEGKTSLLGPFDGLLEEEPDDVLSASANDMPIDRLTTEQWQALCRLLLLADGKAFRKTVTIKQGFVAKSSEKEAFLAILNEFQGDDALRELLYEVMVLPSASFTDQDWEQLTALEIVLKSLAGFLQLRFRAAGECDHSEVTQRANLALQELDNPTDLGLRMDYHLHHILVDEFQDTSNGQIELLKKLTLGWSELDAGPPKTLFLVGDPMQSIYRFREADVSLFLQVADNQQTHVFENLEIESLSLSENFRSSSDLVDWFNRVFQRSFPVNSNVLTGAISYSPASSNKTAVQGDVVYQLAHSKEQEAKLVVDQVALALSESELTQKVAILVRSRGQLLALLPALQAADIEYAGVDIQPLKELQAVIDVLALCKAICREDDRVAWLAMLRGPWCGLSLTDIKQFAVRQDLTIWQQISTHNRQAQLSDSAGACLDRFCKVMYQALRQRQQVSLASLTRWAWRSLGGEHTLMGANIGDIETVFNLIEELQRGADLPSMSELDKALNGLFAMPSPGADENCRVVISTMHKSKGLQYDTVILPGLSNKPRVDDREILMWAEHQNQYGDTNLLLAPLRLHSAAGDHFEYLRKLEGKRGANEAVRLMYVAATRAERKLVLLARAEQDDETGDIKKPASSSLLSTLWDALDAQFSFPFDAPQELTQADLSQTLVRLSSDYVPEIKTSVDWQISQQLNAQQTDLLDEQDSELGADKVAEKTYEWATNAAVGVGTVLHQWLQYNGADVLGVTIDQAQTACWRAELIALRVPETQIEYAVRNLTLAVNNIQQDTSAHFIFETYEIEQNEYVLSAFDNGVVKQSIIDRTFVDQHDVRWIIDYKSTPTNNKDVYNFARDQVETRHKSQLQRYGALMYQIDKRRIQLAVYFPLLKQLISWPYQPNN